MRLLNSINGLLDRGTITLLEESALIGGFKRKTPRGAEETKTWNECDAELSKALTQCNLKLSKLKQTIGMSPIPPRSSIISIYPAFMPNPWT